MPDKTRDLFLKKMRNPNLDAVQKGALLKKIMAAAKYVKSKHLQLTPQGKMLGNVCTVELQMVHCNL